MDLWTIRKLGQYGSYIWDTFRNNPTIFETHSNVVRTIPIPDKYSNISDKYNNKYDIHNVMAKAQQNILNIQKK